MRNQLLFLSFVFNWRSDADDDDVRQENTSHVLEQSSCRITQLRKWSFRDLRLFIFLTITYNVVVVVGCNKLSSFLNRRDATYSDSFSCRHEKVSSFTSCVSFSNRSKLKIEKMRNTKNRKRNFYVLTLVVYSSGDGSGFKLFFLIIGRLSCFWKSFTVCPVFSSRLAIFVAFQGTIKGTRRKDLSYHGRR